MKFSLNKKSNGKKAAKPAEAPASESASSANDAGSESPMDVSLLERLVKLMAAHDLNTVDVRDGDKRVILKRGQAMLTPVTQMTMPVAQAAPTAHAGTPAGGASVPAQEQEELLPIKSPMVGTFYAAPAPDAKPFVSVGSEVDEETDVCVIEAMKVFNNIKAECRGSIAKILVSNGETVEF